MIVDFQVSVIIQTFIVQDTEIKVLGNSHSNYKHLKVASVQ
jgi:hypothetical protein